MCSSDRAVRGILLVFHSVVVALLAFVASEGDLHPCAGFCHVAAPPLRCSAPEKKAPEAGSRLIQAKASPRQFYLYHAL